MSLNNKLRSKKTFLSIISISFLLFGAAFFINFNTLSNKFVFDDKGLITENTLIRNGTTLREIFSTNYRYGAGNPRDGLYRPLVMLTFALTARSGTINPFPFHLFNVVLNAANISLFFILILMLTGNVLIGLCAAIIFIVHPVHTEVVANIAGRPELLCAFFLFLSLVFLEKFEKNFSFLLLFIAAPIYVLALISKETAVMLPVIVIGIDFAMNRSLNERHRLWKYSVILSVVIAYLFVRILVLGETATGNDPLFYNNPLAHVAVYTRIVNAFSIFFRYLAILCYPRYLCSDYSYNSIPLIETIWHPMPLAGIALFMAVIILSLLFRKKSPVYLIAVSLFLFPYFIVSNILFSIGTIMGERFLYIPSAGFALASGTFFAWLIHKRRYFGYSVLIMLLSTYTIKTVIRNHDWFDDATLTEADLKFCPNNIKLLFNMGNFYSHKSQYSKAEGYYRRALEIYPDFFEGLSGLGKSLYSQGRHEESLRYYARSMEVSPGNPICRFDYASVLMKMGRLDEAERTLNDALSLFPDTPLLYRSMGSLMLARDNFTAAIHYFEKAMLLNGNKQVLLNNLALAAYLAGDFQKSVSYVREAETLGIRLNPDMVHTILIRAGIK